VLTSLVGRAEVFEVKETNIRVGTVVGLGVGETVGDDGHIVNEEVGRGAVERVGDTVSKEIGTGMADIVGSDT